MYLLLLFIFPLIFILFIIWICYNCNCRPSTSADNPTLAVTSPTDGPTTAATSQKVGLDPFIFGSLPVFTYGGGAEKRASEECPICLNQFEESDTVKLIPHCRHVFHGPCIDTWLSSHASCPMCTIQMFDDVGEGFSGSDAASPA